VRVERSDAISFNLATIVQNPKLSAFIKILPWYNDREKEGGIVRSLLSESVNMKSCYGNTISISPHTVIKPPGFRGIPPWESHPSTIIF
jgi:hypothetical protein